MRTIAQPARARKDLALCSGPVPERATKKPRRREPPSPWADVHVDALPAGEDKERVLLAMRCFEAGDYAQVRGLADALARSPSEEARAAGAALRSRVGIDKVQVAIVAACLLLFVLVALKYFH